MPATSELTGSSDVEKASLHTAGSLHMGAPPLKTHPRRRFLLFGASGVALALIILFATLFGLAFTGVLSSDKADSSLNAVSNSSLGVRFPDLQTLLNGNARFQAGHADDAELSTLATKGQHPNVTWIGCSDSRVSENVLFDAPIGTFFTDRNIANQYLGDEAKAAVAYSVEEIGVSHVFVVGHFGCGGVQAAIASAPAVEEEGSAMARIQEYIQPIREVFANSTRPEIVAMRKSFVGMATIPLPARSDPGFRALVEENVKANVLRVSLDPVVIHHWEEYEAQHSKAVQDPPAKVFKPVFVHGLVYDIQDGILRDLEVSVGPPGYKF